MNKPNASSTPKPKAHFKIVFSPGAADATQGLRAVRVNPSSPRVNDLQAAINSITSAEVNAFDHSTKENRKSNTVALNADGQKMEKIVFMPKYIQKRVSVVRDSPKKAANRQPIIKKITKTYTPLKKIQSLPPAGLASSSGNSMLKKRKLGDLALETWNAQKKTALPDIYEDATETTTMVCRICGSIITELVVDLQDEAGALTTMGMKLKTIVGTDINDSPLYPSACCKACSFKVNVCYSLLIEMQSSDQVVRATYAELQEGDLVNPSSHIYTCQDCQQEVIGMKEYINHFESHMRNKTVGSIVVKHEKEEAAAESLADDPMLNAQVYLEEESDGTFGTMNFQNDLGEYVCETCGRAFKYIFLLQLHRKAPKRGPVQVVAPAGKVCFVCKEVRPTTQESNTCKRCISLITKSTAVKEEADYTEERLQEDEDASEEMDHETESSEDILDEEEEDEEEVKKKGPAKGKVKCELCHKELLPASLRAHKLNHTRHNRYTCDICSVGFMYKYELLAHLKNHDKKTNLLYSSNCRICLKDMTNSALLRQHLLKEHDIQWQPNADAFTCQHCPKTFDDLFKLRIHMRLYHKTELPNRLRAPRSRQFECHVCKMMLNSENSARLHMRNIHNLSNNQMESLKQACEECGKVFSVKQNLINHVNVAHLKVKPIACMECGERFTKHSSLIFHKLRHTGEKPFQCMYCQKTYRQRNDVMRHLARHVRDKELEYEEAHAVNNSASKFIYKRYIYLKDSAIKGLQEMAMNTPRSLKRAKKLGKLTNAGSQAGASYVYCPDDKHYTNESGEVYEEVILPEGAVLVDEAGDSAGMQYIIDENGDYVLQEPDETVNYIVEGEDNDDGVYTVSGIDSSYVSGPNGEHYELQQNENGEQFLVKVENVEEIDVKLDGDDLE